MSLRLRLSLVLLIIISAGFYLSIRSVLYDLRPQYLSSMEEALVDTAEILAASVRVDVDGALVLEPLERALALAAQRTLAAQIYEKYKTAVSMQVYVCNARGIVVYSSYDPAQLGMDFSRWNDVYLSLQGKYGARGTRENPSDPDSSVLYVAAPIMHDGRIVGTLTVRKASDSVSVFVGTGRDQIILVAIVSVIVITLLILIVTIWVTRPIHALEAYAEQIAHGKRHQVPQHLAPELKRMALALDYMRSALDGKQYVESYVQTLTHEFKSPLSAIAGASELLQGPMSEEQRNHFLANIENEVERLKNLVDRILLLAGLENRNALEKKEAVDVSAVLVSVIESVASIAAQRDIRIEYVAPDDAQVIGSQMSGDAFLIELALRNVIVNAIEFSSAESTVEISLHSNDMCVDVLCADTGPGIPAYARERICERFYSLQRPDGRKSSGLGLSVVKEIMDLHQGELKIERSDERGTCMHLRFPLSP